MQTRPADENDRPVWLAMRNALWPDDAAEHASVVDGFLAGDRTLIDAVFVCERDPGAPIGFIELRVRGFAAGTVRTTVPYVEGWYVEPAFRAEGAGGRLMAHAERWARQLGFVELASDTEVDNTGSIAAHRALGFREVERAVCFLKALPPDPPIRPAGT